MLVVCTDTPMWPGVGAVFYCDGSQATHVKGDYYYDVLVPAGAPSDTLKLPRMAWAVLSKYV